MSHDNISSFSSKDLNISRPRGLWGFNGDGRSQGVPAQAGVYKFPDRYSLRGLTTAGAARAAQSMHVSPVS
jgi:hypothetical protein